MSGPERRLPARGILNRIVAGEARMTIAVNTPANDFDRPQAFHTLPPARARGVEPEDAADSSVELLRTIADVLDIRTVFPRVSDIANKMLPHDAMIMSCIDQNGNVV